MGGGAAAEVCCLGRWVSAKEPERSGFLSEYLCVVSASSGQKNKPASPLKAVSVGRGGEWRWAAFRGLRQRGAPPVLGWEPSLLPSLVLSRSAPTGGRDQVLGRRLQSRPFPGTPWPSFGRRSAHMSQAEISFIGITMKLLYRNIAVLGNVS